MNLHLSNEERLGLKAIALTYGLKPAEIVRRFVSDLTGSLHHGGSDEDLCASAWLNRRMIVEARHPLSPKRQRRVEKLQYLAHQARTTELEALRASRKSDTTTNQ